MRVTGGQLRSRVVNAPEGSNTRPTSSVVREAMFSILGEKIRDAAVLDLFCGSGILSIEAISRGASSAVLVDADRTAYQTAKRNLITLGIQDRCRIYQNDYTRALEVLRRGGKQFDIGFFDPPYAAGYYQSALDAAFSAVFFREAICICEYSSKEGFLYRGDAWEVYDQRRYGSRSIALIRSKTTE